MVAPNSSPESTSGNHKHKDCPPEQEKKILELVTEDGTGITCDEYQHQAVATAIYPDAMGKNYLPLGLCGELAEASDVCPGCDPLELIKEYGDVLWYLSVLASEYRISLSAIVISACKRFYRLIPLQKLDRFLEILQLNGPSVNFSHLSEVAGYCVQEGARFEPVSYDLRFMSAMKRAGGVAEMTKKLIRDKKDPDSEKLTELLASILFNLNCNLTTATLNRFGKGRALSFRTVAEQNLRKLSKRKKTGHFKGAETTGKRRVRQQASLT